MKTMFATRSLLSSTLMAVSGVLLGTSAFGASDGDKFCSVVSVVCTNTINCTTDPAPGTRITICNGTTDDPSQDICRPNSKWAPQDYQSSVNNSYATLGAQWGYTGVSTWARKEQLTGGQWVAISGATTPILTLIHTGHLTPNPNENVVRPPIPWLSGPGIDPPGINNFSNDAFLTYLADPGGAAVHLKITGSNLKSLRGTWVSQGGTCAQR